MSNTATTAASTASLDTPVRFDFKAKDNGDLTVRLDSDSAMAVAGGYDALRLAASAREDGRDSDEAQARTIVAACAARAGVARSALIAAAAEGMGHAKTGRDRECVALLLKAALRADRVAKAGGRRR